MGDPVEIKITATGAAASAQAIEQPAQALRKVEEAAAKATTAVERTAAATKTVGSGSTGIETAARSLRAVEAGAERAAAALARAQASTRSMTSVYGSRTPTSDKPLDLTAGLDAKAMGELDNAGFATARWSAAAAGGQRAADGLRRAAGGAAGGIASAGHAAGNGNEKMQALGTAMLMMTGSAGPLSQAFRAFGAAALSSNGNVSQLLSTLKGGGAMFAGMYVVEKLGKNWSDLGAAVDDVNEALRNVGKDADYSRIEAISDMISRALGMTALADKITGGDQPSLPSATAAESDAARTAAREKQAKTFQERLRPKSAQERVAARMQADASGVWDLERYSREVKREEAADAAKTAREEEAKTKQASRLEVSNDVWGRVQSAKATGIADPHAQRLLDMGVPAWAEAGGGDAQEGVRRLEARWDAEEKAAKDAEDKRKKAAEKAAAARKELGRLDLDAIRQTALDKAQAIEDAAEKEAAALDRAADKLATRAKDAKTKADAAWENLLGGKHADGKSDADDAADRRKAADSKRLERRAKTVIARMEEGQSVTAEGKEIAAAYVERERAKWLAGGAKGAREGADAAAKRRDVAGKTGRGMQKSFEDQDHATDRAALVAEIGGDLPDARPLETPGSRPAMKPTRRSGAPVPARGISAADHATDRAALVAEIMGVPAPEPQRRQGHDPRVVAPVVSASVLNASRTQYPAIAAMPEAGLAGGAVVAELKTSNRLLALIAKSGGVE